MVNNITTNGTTSSTSTSSTSSSSSSSKTSSLGKDDFMKMLIAQLKNQDPMSPMDGTQFSAQLAQFSSLEQLSNINDKLDTSINANYVLTQSISNTLSTSLVGKEVKMTGNSFDYTGQDSINLGYTLPSNAKTASIKVYNSSGALVKTIDNISLNQGDHKLSYDFSDNDGSTLTTGSYTFEVDATSSDGKSMTGSTFNVGVVDSVKFTESGTKLVIDGSEYSISDISEIFGGTDSGGI